MTTMHGDYSPEARTAAEGKARAANVFAEHAELIVAALPDVPEGHVLVAVVDEPTRSPAPITSRRTSIVARMQELEADGWAMVFTSGSSVGDVRRRTDEMGQLARRRAEMITRILARRGAP